jgi:hypothetical protein
VAEVVAARVFRWLRPGRFLALVWGGSPWEGPAPWQQAMSATMQRWMTRVRADDRIPSSMLRSSATGDSRVRVTCGAIQLIGSCFHRPLSGSCPAPRAFPGTASLPRRRGPSQRPPGYVLARGDDRPKPAR